jgi:hypothetical protein
VFESNPSNWKRPNQHLPQRTVEANKPEPALKKWQLEMPALFANSLMSKRNLTHSKLRQ